VETEIILLHGREDFVETKSSGGFHEATGGVAEKLADEVAGEEVFAGIPDDLLETGKVLIGFPGREFP